MKRIITRDKGQILVPAILAVLALFMAVILTVETGNVIFEKIKTQNAADSAAVEAGLWYARSLNIVSISNKILAVSAVAATICEIAGLKGALKTVEAVQKVQDAFAGTGDFEKLPIKPAPLLLSAAVIRNGINNGSACIPVFNVNNEDNNYLPSFNLERRYASELLVPDKDVPGKYSYKRKSDGKKIYVDKDDVRWDENLSHGKGGHITKKGYGGPSRILKEEKGLIPLDVKEKSAEHTVLVIACREKSGLLLNNRFFKNGSKKKYFVALSMAGAAGGTMDILDINGASYQASLVPVKIPDFGLSGLMDAAEDIQKQIPGSGGELDSVSKILKERAGIN